jgi:hypothetical protein
VVEVRGRRGHVGGVGGRGHHDRFGETLSKNGSDDCSSTLRFSSRKLQSSDDAARTSRSIRLRSIVGPGMYSLMVGSSGRSTT